ncbi:hypothetical protein [Streptomyces sp. NPDC048442]|uniref:hypothetical protein n=1 Tax=Streptomyces sp. NPDC048442 TaxID=3154823 RepID=UPI0034361A73
MSALTSAGMLVGWRLSPQEWDQVTALSARWGVEALVEFISRRWSASRPPQTARYLLRIWADLPPQGPDSKLSTVVPLRSVAAGWTPYRNPVAAAYQNGF